MRQSRSADNENKKVGEMISERVTKFPCDEDTVTKLPCDEVTGNPFVHLMIQKKKNFLDCQTLPEKYFGLPEFSTRRYQILQLGGRSPPPPAPLSPTPM